MILTSVYPCLGRCRKLFGRVLNGTASLCQLPGDTLVTCAVCSSTTCCVHRPYYACVLLCVCKVAAGCYWWYDIGVSAHLQYFLCEDDHKVSLRLLVSTRACVRSCVCACVHVCVRACMCVRVYLYACICVDVFLNSYVYALHFVFFFCRDGLFPLTSIHLPSPPLTL